MLSLTSEEISEQIRAEKPFWVGSESERKTVLENAKVLGFKYTTRSDGRGGFNCYIAPQPLRPKSAKGAK